MIFDPPLPASSVALALLLLGMIVGLAVANWCMGLHERAESRRRIEVARRRRVHVRNWPTQAGSLQ